MINIKNKFFLQLKRINNYINILLNNKIISSVLFLRYIFLIFIIVFFIYLLIPKFFNDEKRYDYIKQLLFENYSIVLEDGSKVSYKILPTPRIKIEDLNFKNNFINGDAEYMELILNLSELYNYKYLKLKKISIDESNLFLQANDIENFFTYIRSLRSKIFINKGNLSIVDQKYQIIDLKSLKFNNKKSENLMITGFVFNKKFNMRLKKVLNKQLLFFNIPTIGLNSKIELKNMNSLNFFEADSQLKILDNNFQFRTKKVGKKILIYESFFRNNILQTSFDSNIFLKPYFNFDLLFNVKNINFKKVDLENTLDLINNLYALNSKLNGKLKINYRNNTVKSSFKNNKLINKANFEIVFQNKDILIKTGNINFEMMDLNVSGVFKDYDNFKVFNFNILSNLNDTGQILKIFKIKSKKNNTPVRFALTGFLNLTSNKIKFNSIEINNKNILKKEELDYYQTKFEHLIIQNNILNIFNKKKIKSFIEEIE